MQARGESWQQENATPLPPPTYCITCTVQYSTCNRNLYRTLPSATYRIFSERPVLRQRNPQRSASPPQPCRITHISRTPPFSTLRIFSERSPPASPTLQGFFRDPPPPRIIRERPPHTFFLGFSNVWSSHIVEYESTGRGCQSCSWSAEQGKLTFRCPRSRLRIWSRDTGSAVPSRVSLLVSILRLNRVLVYGIPPEFRGGGHLFI